MEKTDNGFLIKDLYEASIKATFPITILGKTYEEDETILYFDKIEQIFFQEKTSTRAARGGYGNPGLVFWNHTTDLDCSMEMGTISQLAFGLANETIIKKIKESTISQIETLVVDEKGRAQLKHTPDLAKPIHVYLKRNGKIVSKIVKFKIEESTLFLENLVEEEIVADYYFLYQSSIKQLNVGQKDLNGFLKFVGKFRYTDEYTAVQKTGIIEIPKIRIISDFSIAFGRNVSPIIQTIQFQAVLTGDRQNQKALSIDFLEDDIDGDF